MTSPEESMPGKPRRRRHEETRREILDAAWALAERNGIAGLSLREVARTVGMQAPSVYTYFESKDALFDAMFTEAYLQLGEATDEWSDRIDGFETDEAMGFLIQEWIRFCQASPARYQLMFTRALPGWEPSPDAYAASTHEYARMVEALAPLGITERGDLDLYTAVVAGLAAQQLANDPAGDRWVDLAPIAARMVLRDIRRRDT